MAENNSLLNKLRQSRQRTTVPERNDALVKREPQAEQSHEETKSSENAQTKSSALESVRGALPEAVRTPEPQKTTTSDNTLDDLKAQLASFPETQRHSAIVLEKELDQELTRYCKDQGITVETFLEAAWQIASKDEALLEQILDEAQRRYRSRKEAGKLRRLITMLSKQES